MRPDDLARVLLVLPAPYVVAGWRASVMDRGGVRTAAAIAGASAGMAAYRVAFFGVGGLGSSCMWGLVPMMDFGIQVLVVLFFLMCGPFLLSSLPARLEE